MQVPVQADHQPVLAVHRGEAVQNDRYTGSNPSPADFGDDASPSRLTQRHLLLVMTSAIEADVDDREEHARGVGDEHHSRGCRQERPHEPEDGNEVPEGLSLPDGESSVGHSRTSLSC